MAENTKSQWEGKVTAELKGITADQVWPYLEDFCAIHKWFPTLSTSYQAGGEQGKPGLIRYCASLPKLPGLDVTSDNGEMYCWANEKLVMINPKERCLSYEIMENNVGLTSYVGTFQVLAVDGGDGEVGCRLEWSMITDPIQGSTFETYESFRSSSLQAAFEKIKALISVGNTQV